MTDLVEALRHSCCPPNTGCMSMTVCVCDLMQDAADEIQRLRALLDRQDLRRPKKKL